MALFDEIKKKVVNTTQSAVKATKEIAETSRLNSQISDEQRKIENLYSQIGKLYFDKYTTGAEPPFDKLCTGIVLINEQIERLQLEIQRVKGIKRCPSCGTDIPITASFCGGCGTAVETPSMPQDETPPETEVNRCSKCGAKMEDGCNCAR